MTPYDDKHCLGSVETHNHAQEEGFGHLLAAKLWNELDATGCAFIYYKAAYRSDGTGPDNPPVSRACSATNVKYLQMQCGGPTGKGTEWDWLNFYTLVHRGPNATTMGGFRSIYRQACSGSPTGSACSNANLPFSTLKVAAQTVYGVGSLAAAKFGQDGDDSGLD